MGLSRRAYAEHRKALGLSGATDKTVRNAIANGRITLLPDGTIDPSAADQAWGGNSDDRKVRGDKPTAKPDHQLQDDGRAPVVVASPTASMDAKQAGSSARPSVIPEPIGTGAIESAMYRSSSWRA